MPIGYFKLKLRDKKDHFVVTLYKEVRNDLSVHRSSIILLEINGQPLVRIPNKDFHISIPKRFIRDNQTNVEIKILNIYDKFYSMLRENRFFLNHYMNVAAFIPQKTIYGHDIYVMKQNEYLFVWYSVGGGVAPIKIKNKANYKKIAELAGFYFGDGNTSEGIRSFRLNNCEPSVLNYCLDILNDIGIGRDYIKVQIIYSSNREIDDTIRKRCTAFWSDKLKVNESQIVSVNRSKNDRETLKYGSARVFIDSSVLVEIFLHGILKKIINIVKKPKNKMERDITICFLRGIFAAEGFSLLENNSLRRVGISFNPHSNEVELYKVVLQNLNIGWKYIHGNAIMIQKFENFKKLLCIDVFKIHKKRKEKFLLGYRTHKFSDQ